MCIDGSLIEGAVNPSVRCQTILWVKCHITAKIAAWTAATAYLPPLGGRVTTTVT